MADGFPLVGKDLGVFGGINRQVVFPAQALKQSPPVRDGRVAELNRFGKHQNPPRPLRGRAAG